MSTGKVGLMRGVMEEVKRAALQAADPADRVRDCWPEAVDRAERVTVLAVGKAGATMGNAASERLGDRLRRGLVVCPPAHVGRVETRGGRVRALPADHPIPTDRNLDAAGQVASLAESLNENDLLLVLLSGGASAYLCQPAPGIGLADLQRLTASILRSGATINELNAVRKHLEVLKGGGLARLVWPARSEVLVLSDVLGDPLDVIGSGPMSPDPTTFAEALAVIESRGLQGESRRVHERLQRGAAGEIDETPKPGDALFDRVSTTVIGNNARVVEGVRVGLESVGFEVVESRSLVRGEAAQVGRELAERLRMQSPGQAVVWGGETTVSVGVASGVGGRCQELALAAAVALDSSPGCGVIALATDGIDGPTDAAGAWAASGVLPAMHQHGVDLVSFLNNHDSFAAFRVLGETDPAGGIIRTGPTGTNLNDVYVGLRGFEPF